MFSIGMTKATTREPSCYSFEKQTKCRIRAEFLLSLYLNIKLRIKLHLCSFNLYAVNYKTRSIKHNYTSFVCFSQEKQTKQSVSVFNAYGICNVLHTGMKLPKYNMCYKIIPSLDSILAEIKYE